MHFTEKNTRVSTDWKAMDSSITLIHKDVKFGPNGDNEIVDTIRIYYSETQKIEIEKWENYTTWEVVGTIAVCFATVGLIALLEAESFHSHFWHN
jgi:pyruvate/2-oxoglutarate dehydrogenase complex dihydrolipoamide dehydrogenase (E3) component